MKTVKLKDKHVYKSYSLNQILNRNYTKYGQKWNCRNKTKYLLQSNCREKNIYTVKMASKEKRDGDIYIGATGNNLKKDKLSRKCGNDKKIIQRCQNIYGNLKWKWELW